MAVAFDTPVVELLTDADLRRSRAADASSGPTCSVPTFDVDEALRRLRERDAEELGNALLDQRAVAGIGNVVKSEAAFIERLDPWATGERVRRRASSRARCGRPGGCSRPTPAAARASRPATGAAASSCGSTDAPAVRAADAERVIQVGTAGRARADHVLVPAVPAAARRLGLDPVDLGARARRASPRSARSRGRRARRPSITDVPVADQRGEDEGRARAQVGDLDLGRVERRRAGDAGVALVERARRRRPSAPARGCSRGGPRRSSRGWCETPRPGS